MVTFGTWELVGFILLIMVVYTVILVLASKIIGKGLSSKMLYLLPIYPMDTAKRTYAVARQLGVPVDDIKYTGKSMISGKSEYYIKSREQVVVVEPFFGIVVKTSLDSEILESNYHAFSAESISQQHNYLAQLKEQGLEPEVTEADIKEQVDEPTKDEVKVEDSEIKESEIKEEVV